MDLKVYGGDDDDNDGKQFLEPPRTMSGSQKTITKAATDYVWQLKIGDTYLCLLLPKLKLGVCRVWLDIFHSQSV